MRFFLTISALLPLAAIGLILLTMESDADDQVNPNPCPDSFAIYVDDQFVECLNAEKRYRAYP